MVRNYIRSLSHIRNGKNYNPYKSYSNEMLNKAIRDVQAKILSLDAASTKYKVPRSTLALRAKIKSKYPKSGRPHILSDEEENILIDHLNLVASWGFPFDLLDLRLLVKSYLDRKGVNEPRLKNNRPGPDWASNFIKRHKDTISNRLSANISTKRAMMSRQKLDEFFGNARALFTNTDPSMVINFDETNLTDNPGAKKFIFKRGSRYPERVVNSTKTAISIMYAGTADGEILPEYVVYKADHMWDSWTQNGPVGTRYNRSRSGWFDSVCFENWFFTIVVPFLRGKNGPKILVGDNLSSHFSPTVLNACKEMDISFVCLPSNSTHLMQPLDVAFYAPLKKYWRDILSNWKKTAGRKMSTLSKDVFPQLLSKLRQRLEENGKGSENLRSGCRKTGLYPFDPSQPKRRLPPEEGAENEKPSHISDAVLEILKEMRGGSDENIQRQRRKRVTVEPGKSVTAADVVTCSSAGSKNILAKKPKAKKKKTLTPSSSEDENSSLELADSDDGPESINSDDFSLKTKYSRPDLPASATVLNSDDSDATISSDEDLPLINLKKNISETVNSVENINDLSIQRQKLPTSPTLGDWVLVRYMVNKLTRHFVGKVMSISPDGLFTIDFLKKSVKTDRFLIPLKQDQDYVPEGSIVKILEKPKTEGTGRRVFYKFPDDLSCFNCS